MQYRDRYGRSEGAGDGRGIGAVGGGILERYGGRPEAMMACVGGEGRWLADGGGTGEEGKGGVRVVDRRGGGMGEWNWRLPGKRRGEGGMEGGGCREGEANEGEKGDGRLWREGVGKRKEK